MTTDKQTDKQTEQTVELDFSYRDEGSIVMVTPITDDARAWVAENVDAPGWAWMGESFAVDHRMADALLEAIEGAGFSITSS